MFVLNIILVLFCTTGIQGSKKIFCNLDDVECTSKSSAKYYYHEMSGEKGKWNSSDPIEKKIIEIDRPNLSVKLYDVKLTGLLQCTLPYLKVDSKLQTVVYKIVCPRITEASRYKIKGYIGDMYLEGEGKAKVIRDKYTLTIYTNYDTYTGKEGSLHMRFKDYEFSFKSDAKVTYELDDLFDGDKKKEDRAVNYLNNYWENVDGTLGKEVLWHLMSIYMKNINDELRHVPVTEIFYYTV